jgi:hypothetical protein
MKQLLKLLRRAALVFVIMLAAAYGWWRFGTRYVPEGQPPLATVDAARLATLKEDFNRAAGDTRIIVLLSPT